MGEKGKRHRRFYLGVYRIGINLFIVHVFFFGMHRDSFLGKLILIKPL